MVKDTIISREHFLEKLAQELYNMFWFPDEGGPFFDPESWEELPEDEKADYYQMANRALSRSASYLNEETPDGY